MALFIGLLLNTPVTAQSVLRLDGDKCTSGLKTLAARINAQITPDGPPRRVAGKCTASNIRASNTLGGVELNIQQLRWNSTGLTPLETGEIPRQLVMEITGISFRNFPEDDPAWQFLAKYARAGKSFDVEIRTSFRPEERELELHRLELDFGNGNKAVASGDLTNFSPNLLSQSRVLTLAIATSRLDVTVNGNARFGKDIAKLILASIAQDDRPPPGLRGLQSWLRQAATQNFRAILPDRSWQSMNRLIDTVPNPSGSVTLALRPDQPMLLLQLFALSRGGDVKKVLDGAGLTLEYAPGVGG